MTKTTTHTPAPWTLTGPNDQGHRFVLEPGDPAEAAVIAELWACDNDADAALIVAAPDLLAILTELVYGETAGKPAVKDILARARAAIAKAQVAAL